MINSWESFVKLLIDNAQKFNYGIKRYWLDKECGFFENYLDITSNNGIKLFINDDEKTVSIVEQCGEKLVEFELAFNCTYDRYIKLINVIFDINLKNNIN